MRKKMEKSGLFRVLVLDHEIIPHLFRVFRKNGLHNGVIPHLFRNISIQMRIT